MTDRSDGPPDFDEGAEIDMHRIEGRSPSRGAPVSAPPMPGGGGGATPRLSPIPRRVPPDSAQIDPVEFGVAHPVRVARDEPFTLGVWLFKREDRGEANDRALAALGHDAQFLSQGSAAIAHGTAIAITLQIEGWRIEPEAQTVLCPIWGHSQHQAAGNGRGGTAREDCAPCRVLGLCKAMRLALRSKPLQIIAPR